MSDCASLIAGAGSGVGPTLKAVDCMTLSAGATGFGHLFGPQGALAPTLTAALTITVAAYGFALITGRARLALRGVSGQMLGLGLVLAFATSWTVYGPLVTDLATRAPDDVAKVIMGTRGSATAQFAARIDTVFAAVNDATRHAADEEAARNAAAASAQASGTAPPAPRAAQTTGLAPAGVAMAGAMILLLASAGVLVAARIVLAALLLTGPVFVVLALFGVTRPLFAGWLRTLLLAALAPLMVVLGGAFSLELAVPTVARLLGPDGIDAGAAMGFFLIATVHAALMIMGLRAAAGLVAGWSPFSPPLATRIGPHASGENHAAMVIRAMPGRVTATAHTQAGSSAIAHYAHTATHLATRDSREGAPHPATGTAGAASRRASGIGSRFRPATARQVIR